MTDTECETFRASWNIIYCLAMATKVVDFLNESGGSNFTESAPRPPTYGEENELQSNGGNSTKSSNSHKSHNSSKSHSSTKSVASTKGDHAHSPASTPRKSNLEVNKVTDSMTGTANTSCVKSEDGEAVAPLGFEPEGSVANSPHYSENGTPPHSKWAENLRFLLEDSDGVALFRDYMEHEMPGGSEELQFWFACQGLRKTITNSTDLDHSISNIQKVIYKRYVRSDKVKCISKTVKRAIAEKVSSKNVLDPTIFDAAQEEVEKSMQTHAYPGFLLSHYYLEYLQNDTDSPKSSPSSGSDSARPVSQTGLLPVVHEDKELKNEDIHLSFHMPVMNKGTSAGKRAPSSSMRHAETVTGTSLYPVKRPYYPTHISYAPVSAQDSELQSLSSDALTDDTMSVTDGSVDGGRISSKKHIKYAWKVLASENRETATGLSRSIVPRTQHPPKDSQMAQNNPSQFSALLIDKLNRIVEERESTARMEEKILSIVDPEGEKSESEDRTLATFAKANTSASFMPLASAMEEETAESILDQHCSRIWESSNHHTPSYSPPRPSSPPYRSPDRHKDPRSKALVHPAGLSPAAFASRSSHKKREFVTYDIDDRSMLVSGTTETHRHIHYHHYHHHRDSLKKAHVDYESQTGVSTYRTENLQNISSELSNAYYANRGRTHTRKNNSNVLKKTSDSCSNFDSGISVMDSVKTSSMNWGHPASEKVMKWMMNTDIVQEVSTTVQEMEKSSSTHRHSHRLNQSATSTQQIKTCSRSKSAVRSTSVDRSGGSLSLWTGATPAVASPQLSQDASLCLFATPNSTAVQSRTAAAAVAAASPLKSRSFTSVPPKDRMRTPLSGVALPATSSHNRTLPSARTVPSQLDSASANQSFDSGMALRASANTTSMLQSNTETIIGIYMGQEPIPYRHQLPGRAITLAQIKTLLTKKGPFRYYFKRHSDEFGDSAGAVFEEISDNSTIVPLWQGKIVVKVEKMDL